MVHQGAGTWVTCCGHCVSCIEKNCDLMLFNTCCCPQGGRTDKMNGDDRKKWVLLIDRALPSLETSCTLTSTWWVSFYFYTEGKLRHWWPPPSSIQLYFLSITLHHIDHIISIIHGHPSFSSTSYRLDIHTNTPWVHHSSQSASSVYVGLLMKRRGRADTQEKSCPPVKTKGWRHVSFKARFYSFCVCDRALSLTFQRATNISLGLSESERGKSNTLNPSVFYLL